MAVCQEKAFEIGIVTDNDLYTSSKNDQYFTNGLEFFFRFLSKKDNGQPFKKITEFRAGQYIYSPKFIYKYSPEMIDRPFAGYLFGEFGKNLYFRNQSVFKKSVQIGYVGPNSFAEETQTKTHKLFNYPSFEEWEYQIKNTLSVQTHFLFSKKLFQSQKNKRIDFQWQSEANLGTVFTGLSTGLVTRIGFKKLVPIYNSNFYGASVNSKKTESEFYFYMMPSFNYQLYDATIQGSLFKDNSPITFGLVPFRFNGETGIKYRKKNLNLSYAFIYRGKELKHDLNTGYFYGSIVVSYLFK